MIPRFRAWFKGDSENEPEMYGEVLVIDYINKEIESMSYIPILRSKCLVKTKFDDIVLMQNTGLKDKHGKEIFEGDVVYIGANSLLISVKKNYLVADSAKFKLVLSQAKNFMKNYHHVEDKDFIIEVIGNIYENPELLK